MKNKNLLLRTLTCVVGIPLLAVIIFVFPEKQFIAFRLFTVACSILGSIEISKLLFGKVTCLPILSCFLTVACLNDFEDVEYYLALLVIVALAFEIKTGEKDDFEGSANRMGKNLFCIIYPSYLLTFLMRMTVLEQTNSFIICYFFVLVFANDIFAYIMGTIFGEKNNAGLKASPKKSYAGFAGGLFWSLCFSLVYTFLFVEQSVLFENTAFRIVCPIMISLFGDIGDLIESVIKRSAKVKDSSNLIPGHGGVLDRMDSIAAAAPVFYFLVRDFV